MDPKSFDPEGLPPPVFSINDDPASRGAAVPTRSESFGEVIDDALAELGFDGSPIPHTVPERKLPPRWRRVSTWMLVYGIALALIAFWPQPVDSGAAGLLKRIIDAVPLLTYQRIEFGANILLFVPFGIGLSLLLPRQRYLLMPLALIVSLTIESVQAVLLADRTPSLYDILANVAGASIGLVAVTGFEALRGSRPPT